MQKMEGYLADMPERNRADQQHRRDGVQPDPAIRQTAH